MEKKTAPAFRVEGKESKNPKVFLLCSECDKDLRELKKAESINVTIAYYCEDCSDENVIRLNK